MSRFKWVLVGSLLAQCLLFSSFVAREIAWTYPANWDQTARLTGAYSTFEALLQNGPLKAWHSMLIGKQAEINANGVLQPILASLIFLGAGPSRLTALSVNLLCFLCWQAATFFLVLLMTRRIQYACLAWALVLCISSPFLSVGGMMDFRLDFFAMCLFGVWISIATWSGLFCERGKSVLAGIVGGLLILYRYLTALYLMGILGLFLGITLMLALLSRRASERKASLIHRAKNILISGLTVVLVTGPSLWASRHILAKYYFDPNLDRSIWGAGGSFLDGCVLYARGLFQYHLGEEFLLVVAILSMLGVIGLWQRHGKSESRLKLESIDRVVFLVLCLAVPFLELISYPSKQVGVAGIMVPPVIGFAVCGLIWLVGNERCDETSSFRTVLLWAMAAVALGGGVFHQLTSYGRKYFPPDYRDDLIQIAEMYDQIGDTCVRMNWNSPRVSTDFLEDYFTEGAAVLTPLYYERHGRLLNVQPRLGGSIFHITRDQALAMVQESDIVLLTNGLPTRVSALPFLDDMQGIRPLLRQKIRGEFLLVGKYRIYGRDEEVYIRPSFLINGVSGDWVTHDGLELSLPAVFARPFAQLVLKGPYSNVPQGLEVSAQLISETGEPAKSLLTEFKLDPTGYVIRVILPDSIPNESKASDLHIRISFSKYIVPAEVGMGPDTRKLVLWRPMESNLIYQKAPAGPPKVPQ